MSFKDGIDNLNQSMKNNQVRIMTILKNQARGLEEAKEAGMIEGEIRGEIKGKVKLMKETFGMSKNDAFSKIDNSISFEDFSSIWDNISK